MHQVLGSKNGSPQSILAAVIALAACVAALASNESVIIGPEDGWMPLREAAQELKISDSMVERILDASMQLVCDVNEPGATGFMNAWLLGDSVEGVYTSAHATFKDGEERSLLDCRLIRSRDLTNEGTIAPDYAIGSDPRLYSLPTNRSTLVQLSGEELPRGYLHVDRAYDRIWMPLAQEVPGTPLPVYSSVESLNQGREVFFVSAGGPWAGKGDFWFQPMIQKCTVRRLIRQRVADLPPVIFTDCDHRRGTSAGLIFVRDYDTPGDLLAIGMHSGGYYPKENPDGSYPQLPYDEQVNASIDIAFDAGFFTFAIVPKKGPNGNFGGVQILLPTGHVPP